TAAVGLGLGLLVAYLQTPEYRAGAMLQIEPPTPTFLTVTDALVGAGSYWQNTDFYNTQFKVLRSKGLGEKVVERLKLKDRPPFKDNPESASLFMAHVGVEPVPESRLVVVTVTHLDPKEAALWANTLADVYIEQTLASRVEAARKAYDWLQERLAETQQGMREAQDKLLKTYRAQDVFVPEGGASAVATSIAKLNEDYVGAQARRIGIEAALKQFAEMRQSGKNLDTIPQVAADPVVAGLNAQIAAFTVDLSRLKEKYKEGHPEVQRVHSQVAQIQRAKDQRAAQIADGLQAEFAQLQKRESELRSAIDAQKAQAARHSQKATEVEVLKKEAQSAAGLYDVLLQKLNESDIAASIRTNNASVVERASPPHAPVWPNKRRTAGAALVLGLALGLGLVLLRDFLSTTIRDPEEIERYLHLDLLSAVPRYQADGEHLVTEAYQNLRTALLFARKDEAGQVVLVTGTAPQEGKTTTIVNLARLLAGSGERTIVVDCDLRRAQVHQRLEISRAPGFTDYFVRHEELLALIQPTSAPGLFALTAGPLPPNPPAMLARKNVAALFARLRGEFEWILVDSPPLASVTDALLLARHADLAVMVVEHNKVDKKLVKRSVAALRKATPNLLGAVLNAVDLKARSYHYYYYQDGNAADKAPPAAETGARPEAAVKG
ncbi:MAG TPA: polysaccharide biosynthesis tyrosine autokinase, partial [Vicinamibacteria bacterium]|nr:polysaccharide biosynthesis tyrosine autokinase [Vicinamibacteria bacterium]